MSEASNLWLALDPELWEECLRYFSYKILRGMFSLVAVFGKNFEVSRNRLLGRWYQRLQSSMVKDFNLTYTYLRTYHNLKPRNECYDLRWTWEICKPYKRCISAPFRGKTIHIQCIVCSACIDIVGIYQNKPAKCPCCQFHYHLKSVRNEFCPGKVEYLAYQIEYKPGDYKKSIQSREIS